MYLAIGHLKQFFFIIRIHASTFLNIRYRPTYNMYVLNITKQFFSLLKQKQIWCKTASNG